MRLSPIRMSFLVPYIQFDLYQKANMKSLLSNDSKDIRDHSSYFLCTCGMNFKFIHQYEQHLHKQHQLKPFIRPKNAIQKQIPPFRTTKKTQEPSNSLQARMKMSNGSIQNSIRRSNLQFRRKEERKIMIRTLLKGRSSKENSSLDKKTISCYGFKLIKNKYCQMRPYYCGNCETILFEREYYINHCIQDCRTLIHKDSSHMITLNLKEDYSEINSDTQDQQRHSIPQINPQQIEEKKEIQYLQQKSNPQQIAYQGEMDNWLFKEIIDHKLDHKSIPFYCGQCRINFCKNWYYRHIIHQHGEKIHENSSHIIVKCLYKSKTQLSYISSNVPWITQEKQYYCPCNSRQRFRMEDFIRHIKSVHGGISLLYVIQRSQSLQQQYTRKAQKNKQSVNEKDTKIEASSYRQEMFQSHQKQLLIYQNIYDILLKMQDHKIIPFLCKTCQITFKRPSNYKRHIQSHHQQPRLSYSHVILKLKNGKKQQNLYICPDIKWHHDYPIYFCPCSIDSKMNMSHLLQHVIIEHNGISPPYYQKTRINRKKIIKNQRIIRQDPMNILRNSINDHKDIPFSCSECNLQIKNAYQYKMHMKVVHNNKIPPSSSHIILLFKISTYRQRRTLLISPSSQQKPAEHSNYYCSCEPKIKMTMPILIHHIIQNHHGVSPEYCFKKQLMENDQTSKIQQSQDMKGLECTKQEQ